MYRQSMSPSPQISRSTRSRSKGISLSRNSYAPGDQAGVININVFVESVSLKQPKVNINYIWNNNSSANRGKTDYDYQSTSAKERRIQPTERRSPLNPIQLNRSVYLRQQPRQSSPGISLSLLRKTEAKKQREEKIQYKRKSISIQQSKLFQTAILHQNTQTPIKHLGPSNRPQKGSVRKSIMRSMTQY